MFIGRKKELDLVEKMYASDTFECLVLYGRRRVGKTALINEFVKNKRVIYFTGTDTTAQENLENLSQSIYQCGNLSGEGPVYKSYEQALDAIGNKCLQQKTVVVFDEYPYLAKSEPSISSILQKKIDLIYQKHGNMFLILCGSSMSFMEHQVLGYQSPLYGRRTSQLKLQPFSYFEVKQFFNGFSDEEKAVLYGISGGIPKYILCMNESKTLSENITEQFFSTSGYLYEEPENLLKQELREPAMYNAIIRAAANGKSKMSDLASSMNVSSSKLAPYLNKLLELGILTKQTPVFEPEGRKTIYSVADGMFRFWYLTVPPQNMLIQRGLSEYAFQNVKPSLETFMGKVFEQICIEYLWKEYPTLPVLFTEIGNWWGADPIEKKTEEIDIVAGNKEAAIFCECKWRNREVTEDVLETLIKRSLLVNIPKRYYMVFSKAGFTSRCRETAREKEIFLVSFSEMNED